MEDEIKVPNLDLCIELFRLGITKNIQTERIWIRLAKKPVTIPVEFNDWQIRHRYDLRSKMSRSGLQTLQKIGSSGLCDFPPIPAPNVSEMRELLPNGLYDRKHTVWAILDPKRIAQLIKQFHC